MKLIFSIMPVVWFGFVATTAHAEDQPVCMTSTDMEASLVDWYGETPVEKQQDGSVIWTSANGETWTRISYKQDGQSCVVAIGTNWSVKPKNTQTLAENHMGRG